MKYLFLTLTLFITTTFINAEEIAIKTISSSLKDQNRKGELPDINDKSIKTLNKGFFYLKTGATSGVLDTDPNILVGIGYRSRLIQTKEIWKDLFMVAFDLNIQVSNKQYLRYTSVEIYLPKFNMLYFFSPKEEKSFFLGTGWFGAVIDPSLIIAKDTDTGELNPYKSENYFSGSGFLLTLGYESSLHTKFMNTMQIELNIPIESNDITNDRDYSNTHWTVNLSYCIGY